MAWVELSYGGTPLRVNIPDGWLGEVARPRGAAPAGDVASMVAAALDNPIGAPPLARLARPGRRVALIVDDYTRKTPVRLILPGVLERLLAAGVRQRDIRIVVALGTHRPMTGDELAAKLGAGVMAEYEVVNTPSTADAEMVYLGTSSNGIPAWVNRAVAEAGVRIGLGMITPHMDAGFSGGAKIILPGVCSARTVDAFHAVSAFLPENQLGNVDSPLRRNLEQFVSERVPLDFIVNAVVTPEGEVYQCVAGHPVEAHRVGVAYSREVFGTPVARRYPVVVANCYPYDVDWWQSFKGTWAGDLVTADGGTLVLVTAAPEGHSTYPLLPAYCGREAEEVKAEIRAGTAADDKQAAGGVMFANLKRRVNLVLVSDGLAAADAEVMGIAYGDSVEDVVAEAVGKLPAADQAHSVVVIPHAGIVLPLVGEG